MNTLQAIDNSSSRINENEKNEIRQAASLLNLSPETAEEYIISGKNFFTLHPDFDSLLTSDFFSSELNPSKIMEHVFQDKKDRVVLSGPEDLIKEHIKTLTGEDPSAARERLLSRLLKLKKIISELSYITRYKKLRNIESFRFHDLTNLSGLTTLPSLYYYFWKDGNEDDTACFRAFIESYLKKRYLVQASDATRKITRLFGQFNNFFGMTPAHNALAKFSLLPVLSAEVQNREEKNIGLTGYKKGVVKLKISIISGNDEPQSVRNLRKFHEMFFSAGLIPSEQGAISVSFDQFDSCSRKLLNLLPSLPMDESGQQYILPEYLLGEAMQLFLSFDQTGIGSRRSRLAPQPERLALYILADYKEGSVILKSLLLPRGRSLNENEFRSLYAESRELRELEIIIPADPPCLLRDNKVFQLSVIHSCMDEIEKLFYSSPVTIPSVYLRRFFTEILAGLKEKYIFIETKSFSREAALAREPAKTSAFTAELYIDYMARPPLFASPCVALTPSLVLPDGKKYNPLDSSSLEESGIDICEAASYIEEIAGCDQFIVTGKSMFYLLENDENAGRLFFNYIPAFRRRWKIFYGREFSIFSEQKKLAVKIRCSGSGAGLFNVGFTFQAGGKSVNLEHIISSVKKGSKYIKLKNNETLFLDPELVTSLNYILEDLGLDAAEESGVDRPGLLYLKNYAETLKGVEIETDPESEFFFSTWSAPARVEDRPVPSAIKAVLRDYQKDGFLWLGRLADLRLNGILADDMGLGKTLQTIALLAAEQEKKKQINIIICPTSLVYNWQKEIEKFCPSLVCGIAYGTPAQRKKILDTVKEYHIIITSYNSFQNDLERYKKIKFNYCVIDEAQHIKNFTTGRFRAICEIKSERRLALTGTPIENSLQDLWSLFEFLIPGYLKRFSAFKEEFISGDCPEKREQLKKKIGPFIMRRLKSEVLSELPPKTIIDQFVDLHEGQKELYISLVNTFREELSSIEKNDLFSKSRMEIFSILTRLRQICCHPSLIGMDDGKRYTSAKFELLDELVSEALSGRHRIILFSQFTSMLGIIAEHLREQEISYEYLDGNTRNRMARIENFNRNSDIGIFLVSLKAGGTGLNLTEADTVILYDPWWNPAVENQAMDRVHRLGQKNSVSAYRLITRGTIEEKIYELQKFKKELSDSLIGEKTPLGKMTIEDVRELISVKDL